MTSNTFMWVSTPQVNVSSASKYDPIICHVPTLIFSLIILDHGHLIPKHHVLIGRRDLLFSTDRYRSNCSEAVSPRIYIGCAIYKSKRIVDFPQFYFGSKTGMSIGRTRIFLAGLFGPSWKLSSSRPEMSHDFCISQTLVPKPIIM